MKIEKYFCDWCGEELTDHDFNCIGTYAVYISQRINKYELGSRMDLCRNCYDLMIDYVKMKRVASPTQEEVLNEES